MEYRILIVHPDAAVRRRQAEALIAAPPMAGVSFLITTTGSAAAARLQATRRSFHLLIASLGQSNEMLELAATLRELHPQMRMLLIVEQAVRGEQISRAHQLGVQLIKHVNGPDELNRAVAIILGLKQEPVSSDTVSEPAPATLADLQQLMDNLRRQTHALLAIYTDHIGNIIVQRGDASGIELTALISLVAGSFVNAIELGHILRDPETSHLAVHEGTYYDVYATNAGAQRLVTLVFEKEFVNPKLGFVWLLLKRSAEQLRHMQLDSVQNTHFNMELGSSLNSEFDRLFGDELLPTDTKSW